MLRSNNATPNRLKVFGSKVNMCASLKNNTEKIINNNPGHSYFLLGKKLFLVLIIIIKTPSNNSQALNGNR